MFDDDSKDNRIKAKDALLEWVQKKTTGYVKSHFYFTFFSSLLFVNISLYTQV